MLTSTQLLPLLPVFPFLKHIHSIFPFCSLSLSLKSNCPHFFRGTNRMISYQVPEGGGEEAGKKNREVKKEMVRRKRERKRELESRGSSLQSFVLLAQWLSVNATHRASLLERRGYLCDRMQNEEWECVCVWGREHICVCSAFVARCKIEFVCLLPGVCAQACVYVCACMCAFLRSSTWAHTLAVTYLLQRRGSNPRYRAPHRIIAFLHPPASHLLFVPNRSHARSEIYLWVWVCSHMNK